MVHHIILAIPDIGLLFILIISCLLKSFSINIKNIALCSLLALCIFGIASNILMYEKIRYLEEKISFFNDHFTIDKIGIYTKNIISASIILFISIFWNRIKESHIICYCTLFLGSVLILSSNSFISVLISVEIFSFAMYFLMISTKNNNFCISPIIKYVLLNSLLSSVMLYGISLIYTEQGTVDFATLSAIRIGEYSKMTELGIELFIIYIIFKIGLFPFHVWIPSIYKNLELESLAILSTLYKVPFFALIVKFIDVLFIAFSAKCSFIIMICSCLSIFIGSIGAMNSKCMKALLAFSSIANSGYIALFISTENQIYNLHYLLYIAIYIINNFIIIKKIDLMHLAKSNQQPMGSYIDIKAITQDMRNDKLSIFIFGFAIMSLAAFPPLPGFMMKLLIIKSSINYKLVSITIIISSVITIFYSMRILSFLFQENNIEVSMNYNLISNKYCAYYIFILLFSIHIAVYPYCI